MPNEPYSAEDVVRIVTKGWESPGFATWRERNRIRKLLLHREYPVDIKGIANVLEFRVPDLLYHAQLYDNYMDGADLEVSVIARSDEKAAQSAASRVEDFLNALYFDFKRRQSNRFFAPDRRRIGSAVRYGCGIARLGFSDHARSFLVDRKKYPDMEALRAALPDPGFTQNPFTDETPDLDACAWEPNLSRF